MEHRHLQTPELTQPCKLPLRQSPEGIVSKMPAWTTAVSVDCGTHTAVPALSPHPPYSQIVQVHHPTEEALRQLTDVIFVKVDASHVDTQPPLSQP